MTEPAARPRPNRSPRAILNNSSPHGSGEYPGTAAASLRLLATVPLWWRRRARLAGVAGRGQDVARAVAAPPRPVASLEGVLPHEELIEATAEELADAYVRSLDPGLRAATGRHYTPPALAQALWWQSVQTLGRLVPAGLSYDPAAGAGLLLLPALRSWLAAVEDAVDPPTLLGQAPRRIAGRDLDPDAVWLGNVLLASELLPVWARVPAAERRPLPSFLRVADGLDPLAGEATITVLNPPYGRVRLSDGDRCRWQRVLHGHANIYSLFIAAAVASTAPGGVVSALVPSGWLGGAYFSRLRAHLSSAAPLARVCFVDDRAGVFSTGVLQETLLATFCPGGTPIDVRCDRVMANGTGPRQVIGLAPAPSASAPAAASASSGPWLLPRRPDDLQLIEAANRLSHRLSDFGWRVRTGPLVWNRHKDQLSSRPRAGSMPVIWAGDLDDGRLHRAPSRDGMRHVAVRDDRQARFLTLAEPAVLVQRTTAPEQARRIVAAAMDGEVLAEWGGQVVVENHVNVLTCSDPSSALTPRLLSTLLDSPEVDRLYRCLTGSVAVSAHELRALPLPPPDVVRSWAKLSGATLTDAVRYAYGRQDATKPRNGSAPGRRNGRRRVGITGGEHGDGHVSQVWCTLP